MLPIHVRCVSCVNEMPVVRAQLLSGTIADLSSREHRLAICAATDSLRHLRVRTLYPIHDRASGKCPHFCPFSGFFWRLVRESSLEQRTLTTGFSFLESIAALDADCPADDREALRSFAVLHDVRRLDVACISVVHAPFLMSCLATLNRHNRPSDLQLSYRRSLCQQRLCIHSRGK